MTDPASDHAPASDAARAVLLLQADGLPVEATDYGFRLLHPELKDRAFGECGIDHDSSISMSMHTDETPPAVWFFRISFLEMAEFIVAAHRATNAPSPTRAEILQAMRTLDQGYDDTALNAKTEAFLAELEE